MSTAQRYTAAHAAARANVINAAIAALKFPESRREVYESLYDVNPAEATRLIAKLEPGLPSSGIVAGAAASVDNGHRALLSSGERRRIEMFEAGSHMSILEARD